MNKYKYILNTLKNNGFKFSAEIIPEYNGTLVIKTDKRTAENSHFQHIMEKSGFMYLHYFDKCFIYTTTIRYIYVVIE